MLLEKGAKATAKSYDGRCPAQMKGGTLKWLFKSFENNSKTAGVVKSPPLTPRKASCPAIFFGQNGCNQARRWRKKRERCVTNPWLHRNKTGSLGRLCAFRVENMWRKNKK